MPKPGRTSEPRPWNRLAARLFDYSIWGLVLALLLSALHNAGVVSDDTAFWVGHPLFAPILITLTWVPIEALLIAALQLTPGKWLFGIYLQFSISDAYARRDVRAQLRRALRRSFRVWWEGIACGFPLLTPILVAVAYEKIAQHGETDWDFAEDCLVTHSPPGVLNTITGVVGLAAMLWLYGVAWHEPMADSITAAKNAVVAWVPSPPSLLPRGFQGDVGKISAIAKGIGASLQGPEAPVAESANDVDTTALFAERQAPTRAFARGGPAHAAGRATGAAQPRSAALGPTSSSGIPNPGAAWDTRCRRRAIIRRRSTRSARPCNTIPRIKRSIRQSTRVSAASSPTS